MAGKKVYMGDSQDTEETLTPCYWHAKQAAEAFNKVDLVLEDTDISQNHGFVIMSCKNILCVPLNLRT